MVSRSSSRRPRGVEVETTTDRAGRYVANVSGAGLYRVIFVFDRSRSSGSVVVEAGRTALLDGEVSTRSGEIIYVRDLPPPPVAPRPPKRVRPRYSDKAIVSDVWTRAWLLLDVDARGNVSRAKFLHRPGSDLDDIALETAFKTHFDPARDAAGNPIRARTIWGLEWPSYWWSISGGSWTRCRGTGPLNLDAIHPVYRDCTLPDLAGAEGETWMSRPLDRSNASDTPRGRSSR
jgi:hypothetical protein